MSSVSIPRSFADPWSRRLKKHRDAQLSDFPNYHVSDPETLITTSSLTSLTVGNGASIYRQTLLPALLQAKHEIIIVTCFWAESDTLASIKDALEQLAAKRRQAMDASPDPAAVPPLRLRIGLSSRSLFQKIFHTRSRDGHVYPSTAWRKLGLPSEQVLMASRIDLQIKSLFFLPFSVMHPKFVIVDRAQAFMPSCNVSWETWFEGCVGFTGPAVGQLMRFYSSTWGRGSWQDRGDGQLSGNDSTKQRLVIHESSPPKIANSVCQKMLLDLPPTPTILLPSSHHVNPAFRYLPFIGRKAPPETPLNAALLTLFDIAQRRIDIVTPNVTCNAVVDALLAALARGVDVRIRTSYNMMLIEQIVTAFTTTERTLKSFIQRYQQLVASHREHTAAQDMEAQRPQPGRLEIMYFKSQQTAEDKDEPVFSHLKMTLVDEAFLVLGSGNMDRASWYTSQELGVLLYLPGFADSLWDAAWDARMEVRYRSGGDEASVSDSTRRLR